MERSDEYTLREQRLLAEIDFTKVQIKANQMLFEAEMKVLDLRIQELNEKFKPK